MEDRSPELLGVGISFILLAWIAFCGRIYVRALLLRKWGMDDWLMFVAIVGGMPYIFTSMADVCSRPSSQHTLFAKQRALLMVLGNTSKISNHTAHRSRSCFGGSVR